MAILLIILALFGFVFAVIGSGSSGTTGASTREYVPQKVTRHARPWKSCVIVTWKKDAPAQRRPCPPPAKR